MVALDEVLTERSERVLVEASETFEMTGIYSYARGLFAKPAIAGSDTAYKLFHRIHADQIVLSTLKGWEGAIALADTSMAGRFLPPHNILFDVAPDAADPAYIGWAIKQPQLWDALKGASRGMGARRETVSPDDLLAFCIQLPPLPEQRQIVARLEAAAAAIAARAEQAALVEGDVAATLAAAFARITADAPRAPMGDVAPLVRRPVTIDPDATYPELGARSFGRGLFTKPDVIGAEVTWQALYRIEAGDLVFSNIKAWEGAFAVAGVEHAGKHGSHRYLTCVPDPDRATAGYLWYYLQSESGMLRINEASPGSADRNRTLATKRLAAIKVPVPSLDAQRWFDTLQAKAHAARKAQADAAAELAALLPAMLNEAFGEFT